LDLNSRISATGLAKKLRKAKETINFRINRLIRNGYIKNFYTVFNTSKLGWYYHKVYIKFRNLTPEKEKELFNYISGQEHIAYLASVEGYYDAIILLMVRSHRDMQGFMDGFMSIYGEYIQEKEMCIFLSTHRMNQRFLYSGEEKQDWFYQFEISDYKLDNADRSILKIISANARMPIVNIADKAGIDHKIVKYRLRKLEKDSVILAYVTSPDSEKMGFQFVQVNISLKYPSQRRSVIQFFNKTEKCLFAIELLGKYDLTIELHIENHEELKKIIDEFRNQFVTLYNDYDISTINKEYVMVWSPFN
ncbi:Lrp/AsnC family transcriptional regulator, partial [Candidatus Woesearchaeota archaeon]|nr:Lrp/AsnC family transcriptional regulator [Candidatus Woesearchaeota archaeon]